MPGAEVHLEWLEHLPLPGGVVRDSRFLYVNDALVTLVGYGRDELVGRSFLFPVALEDRERMRERHVRRVRGEPVTDTYEFDVVRADGGRRRVEIWIARSGADTLFQLYDRTEVWSHQRKILALAQLGATVQGEPNAEAILARVDAGVSQLGMMCLRVVPEGDQLRMTHRAAPAALHEHVEKLLGASPEGRMGPWSPGSRAAWQHGISYIDDFPSVAARYWGTIGAAVRDVALSQRVFHGVFLRIDEAGTPSHMLLLCADWLRPEDVAAMSLFGTQVTAALTAARVIADLSVRNDELTALNRIATIAGTCVDLSTLFARGCEAIEQVLRCRAVAIYLARPDAGVLVLAHQHRGSEEAHRLYGRVPIEGTRLGEVLRSGLPRVLVPEDYADPVRRRVIADMTQDVVASVPLAVRSEVIGVMNVAFSGRSTVEPRELAILQAAAAHFAAAADASQLIDNLRESYADLARAQAQLVNRERLAALGELAAAVAHEVRNPLGVIFNSLGSLRRLVAETGDSRVLFDILSEEAQRLNAIVGDLLEFARPMRLNLYPAQLAAIVDEAVAAAVVESSGTIGVERECQELPAVVMDSRLIRQAVLNVALNAVQSIQGSGTVHVRVRRAAVAGGDRAGGNLAGGNFARVEIADTGNGIPADVLPRIFEPFFTTRAKGTGLGLALVKRIVEEHGGHASVSSEPGHGTTFVIELPMVPDANDPSTTDRNGPSRS